MDYQPIGEDVEDTRPIGETPEVSDQPTTETSLERDLNAYLVTRDENASEASAYSLLAKKSVENIIESSLYTEEQTEERHQRLIADMQEKIQDVYNYPDLAYDRLVAVADPEVDINDFRYNVNTEIGLKIIKDLRTKEAKGGHFGDAVLDFGSFILRESTTAIPYNITKGSEEAGRELAQRRLSMRPSEFKEWFSGYAQEIMGQGVRADVSWNIDQLENELTNNGYDPMAGLNQAFAVLDLGGLVTGSLKLAKAATRAATSTGRLAITKGVEEATETAVARLSRVVEEETLADVGPSSLSANKNEVGVSQSAYGRIVENNRIAKEVFDLVKAGTFGRVISPEDLATKTSSLVSKITNEVAARTARKIYDTSPVYTDNLGNYFFDLSIGKSDGSVYKPTKAGGIPANVEDLAKKLGGVAKFVDDQNPKSGVVIQIRQNVDTNKLIDEIDIFELNAIETNTFLKIANNPLTSSSTARGVDALSVAAQRGEAGAAKLVDLFNKERAKIDKLNATERSKLAMITNLRDGSGTASRRTWYTNDEFVAEYSSRYGQTPSQKVVDAYDATVTVSDAAWLLKDAMIFKKYVTSGYKSVQVADNVYYPAKEISKRSIPDDANILDLKFGGNIMLKDFLREKDVVFYKLDKALDDGTQFVADPKGIREVQPADVFGYNAGGPRVNPHANYFIVTGNGTRVKTLLAARTEKEANTALKEIEAIRQARASGNLTDEFIQNNNKWNPDVDSVAAFEKFAKEHKWKLDTGSPIGMKKRDEAVVGTAVGDGSIEEGMSFMDFAYTDMRRNDTVLPSYGGGKAYNVDTVTAVQQQFGSIANQFAFNVYTQKVMVGWVKTIKNDPRLSALVKFPANIHPDDYRNSFLRAEITGTDSVSNRLREIRNIEKRRMSIQGEVEQAMTNLGERIAEHVFDLGEYEVAKRLGARSDFVQGLIKNPSSALLRVGFTTAFGFLNVSQLLVQSAHAISIMAMSKQGMRGASMAMTLRGLYHQSPEVIEEGLKRAAKQYGYTPEKMREVYDYIRTSGRDIIEGEAIELGTGADFGISSFRGQDLKPSAMRRVVYNGTKYGRMAMDKGLMFYRAGERASRMTSSYTAVAEFIEKFPQKSLNSEFARDWIMRRDQNLSLNMTTASRAFGTSGVMRVPTQWLQYNLRAMEAVFVGRGLSKGERARLAGSLTMMYGMAGFGMESFSEEVADTFGIPQDSALFTGLKWGVIDGIMDALLTEGDGDVGRIGTGIAPRLSVIQGMKSVYNDITQGKFLEVIGGPSGQIGGSLVEAGFNTIGSLLSGQPVTLTEDVMQIIRQPSGLDNIAKAIGIFNNGQYVSKRGVPIPSEMSATEGILQLFGVASLKQTEWYSARTQAFNDDKKLSSFRSNMNSRAEVAFRYLDSDDPETVRRGLEYLREINVHIKTSGFSPEQQLSLGRSVMKRDEEQLGKIIKKLLKYDVEAATRLQSVMR